MTTGTPPGKGTHLTSAASSIAHGIDAGTMRAAERLVQRAIAQGRDTDGFVEVAELLSHR
ncbi:imine reductase family protein [Streptomyces sp. NBC_00690]|uniref:imine reductase family protein n=1 Tax=Streptomyces sp. NBC_00690 TaxID=2975808 RepID=UPI002E2E3E38|nr:hypothetical protein [Streptomyces sp. NBC_00690]